MYRHQRRKSCCGIGVQQRPHSPISDKALSLGHVRPFAAVPIGADRQYAGYIDPATSRFIRPGSGPDSEREKMPERKQKGSGSGEGGGGDKEIDPIIRGLLDRLPSPGDVWPDTERKLWLQLLEGSFKLIHKDVPAAEEGTEPR